MIFATSRRTWTVLSTITRSRSLGLTASMATAVSMVGLLNAVDQTFSVFDLALRDIDSQGFQYIGNLAK
jgi:hypothetical protein